jgi:hypothetical protein
MLSDVVGQKLQSHPAAETRIFRLEDDTHSTTPDLLEDAVMRDGLAGHAMARYDVVSRSIHRTSYFCKIILPTPGG